MFSLFHAIISALTARERTAFRVAATIFFLAFALRGVSAFYESTTIAPAEGGTYVEGIVGQPVAVNPLISLGGDADRDLMELLFADLTELAESVQSTDGERTWTVRLRERIAWSDGTPLTSDDVVFTVHALQDPETASPLAPTWQGVLVERAGEREVRFILRTPYAFFADTLAHLKVVPEHIFGTIPAANLRLSDYNFEPVGSGPYRFVSLEKRRDGFITAYRLAANPQSPVGAPFIEGFTFKFFSTADEAIEAFNRRTIDGLGAVAPDQLEALKVSHQLSALPMPRYYALFFNPSAHAALKEREVRAALERATDRAGLVADVLAGYGIPISGPLYPLLSGYDRASSAGEPFSTAAAAELLESRQWKTGEGGIREKKIGKETVRLSFEVVVPDIPFLVATAERLKTDWFTVGVEFIPLVINPTEVAQGVIRTRDYQVLLFGNVLRGNPDMFSFWHSSERFRPGLNLSLYENRAVDAALEAVRTEADAAERSQLLAKIQGAIVADKPALFLYSPHYLYASPRTLGGVSDKIIANAGDRFADVKKW